MSGKRSNLSQITRENPDDEDDAIDQVTLADASIMSRRKIAVPRSRRTAAGGAAKSNPFAAPANPFASSAPQPAANNGSSNNDKLLQRRALNEKFVAKLNDLAKDNVYGDWSKTVQQYVTYSNQIESGSISKPDTKPVEAKPASSTPAFSFGSSSSFADKPSFGGPSFSSEKPFSFGAPKPAVEAKPAPSLFQFGKPAAATSEAPLASAQKSTATEADKVDAEKPVATTQSTTKDDSEDSDDEMKVEGPKFTLAAPPTTKDSPFSFNKPATEEDKSKSGAGFKFESSGPVKSVFKFDAPKEEPKKGEPPKESAPAKPFSFGAPATTWTPEKGIKFGSADSTSTTNTAESNKPAFSFGGNTGDSKPALSFGGNTGAFSFGAGSAAGESKPATSAFSFSSTATDKADDKPKFTFGDNAKSTTSNGLFGSTGGTKPFTFNAPSTGFSFGGAAQKEEKKEEEEEAKPQSAAEGDDDNTPNDSAATTPAAEHDLSEKGPGEEEEDVKYEKRAKLYELVGGEFKVQGLGILRVLKHKQTKKSRALIRAEGSGRVILNVLLRAQIKYTTEGKGQVKIIDFKTDGKPTTYMVRVKTQEDGEKLRDVLEAEKS